MRPLMCLFAALLTALPAAAQTTPPPRDAAARATATAAIRGRILDAVTGQPIPGAIVRVMPKSVSASVDAGLLQTAAGPNGVYEVNALSAGEYIVVAGPAELSAMYLQQVYGAQLPLEAGGFPPSPPGVGLRSGETLENLDIRLPRALAIEGRVVNEYGDPLAEVRVAAEAVAPGMPLPDVQTDDRGSFRLFGLGPGRYRVCATPVRTDIRGASGNALRARLVRTCYPSALVDAESDVIALTTADAEGVVIQLRRSGTFTIAGRVVDGSGAPAPDAYVGMTRITREGSTVSGAPDTRGGTFVIRGVAPGDYILTASAGHSTDPDERRSREHGFLPVRVESDLTGLIITTSPGATITGRVVFAGTPPPRRRLSVHARRTGDGYRYVRGSGPEAAPVREDSTFQLSQLHGPLALDLTGLPDGWIVASVIYRGREIADVPVEFTSVATPDDLVVRVTDRTARLIVRAVDENGSPAAGAQVLVLPADSERWPLGVIPGPGPMAQWRRVRLEAMPPGKYLAVAVPVTDVIAVQRDPKLFAALARVAQEVTLRPGEPRTLDVRITPLPPR